MPTSKLTNAFHIFGAKGVIHARATATSIVRRVKRGKIYVQPEAVKQRKLNSGSRAKQSKGQVSKNNLFSLKPSRGKRLHQFAHNVRQNQPVSKKAGRELWLLRLGAMNQQAVETRKSKINYTSTFFDKIDHDKL